jgi:hypothetical protein
MAGILGNQYFKEISTFFKNTLSGNSGTRTAGGKSEGFTIGESGESTGVKVALVIGNKDYTKMPALVNPLNDARDLEKSLRELGCEVLLKENLKTKKEMKLVLGEFREELGKKKAEIGIFFYAGHGLQGNDGKNYLDPHRRKTNRKSSRYRRRNVASRLRLNQYEWSRMPNKNSPARCV